MTADLEPGDVVVDLEQAPEERNRAVAIRIRDETVSDVVIEGKGRSVAQLNPNYAPDEAAVEAAFLKDVEKWVAAEYEATEEVPDVSVRSLQEAAEAGEIKTYTYPEGRLRVVRRA